MITDALATKIISEVEKLLDEDMIIVNVDGEIIASTEKERIGTFHEGALLCVAQKQQRLITREEEHRLAGVKPGLNLPVFFLNQVIAVIGITGEPEQTLPYGELLRKMTELLIRESYYSEQMQWRSRMLEAFVFDWLYADWEDGTLAERADVLNIDLHPLRRVILLAVSKQQDLAFQGVWPWTHLWNDAYEEDIFIPWGDGRLLLVHCVSDEESRGAIERKLARLQSYTKESWESTFTAGVGQVVESAEIQKGYEQAELALALARKEGGIVFEEDLRLDLCLEEVNAATKREFVRRILGNVSENDELVRTFAEYFRQNQSLKSTAASLHIHINTLHYRIKKLEKLTRLDMKHFPDVMNLYLALSFLEDPPILTVEKT
ncbi:CdaR family transcriptional regulator [Shouchella shacheensis]|uniref:CdaR family transcriptional regulator n=1 Tax=Shouchella shacheensis TaxID=1649580 RepID=UPI0007403A93|nr:sugar diacid recognition domain-containing protein [Shouchella shacheensis]